MQKIKDVLCLHLLGGLDSRRQLARAVGCGKSALSDCLRRARVASLIDWGQIADLAGTTCGKVVSLDARAGGARLEPSIAGLGPRA